MRKTFLLVVSILLVSIMLTGCGKKQNTYTQDDIDRLEQQVDREIERTNEYKEDLEEAEDENAEQLATITRLEAELAEKDSNIYSLESQLESSSSESSAEASCSKVYSVDPGDSNSYLAKKFWFDGFNYSADTTWYSDISCKPETKMNCSVIIISPIVDKMEQSNGYIVYVCMSSGGLVYSTSYPYLVKIDN
ncbi:MAG: hypothetical protein HFJ41_01115 [Clostridia bacterium]|nr:hypothetical protein [Clostridia bacterium]